VLIGAVKVELYEVFVNLFQWFRVNRMECVHKVRFSGKCSEFNKPVGCVDNFPQDDAKGMCKLLILQRNKRFSLFLGQEFKFDRNQPQPLIPSPSITPSKSTT
jgi:hypothetical protein